MTPRRLPVQVGDCFVKTSTKLRSYIVVAIPEPAGRPPYAILAVRPGADGERITIGLSALIDPSLFRRVTAPGPE
ncbi:MAG: hypothetical protein GC191_04775 [Azospirillum sp.]|nr:hypothetical protein [Azospirillum sp.]